MKMSKKLISVVLSLCILLSAAAVGGFSGSAAEIAASVAAPFDAAHPELAQQTVSGGAILHCFCWTFEQIRANLPAIKAAGYTAVQTSPVQPPKDYSSSYTDTQNNWWKLYQPLDLCVATGNSWLGTSAQLGALCTEAHTYGIKVIVDIVSNHVANNQDNSGTFEHIHADVAQRLRKEEYYHDIATQKPSVSTDRYEMTHYHIGMPDLNTANADVQGFVIGLCEECIDLGVDGFRFDTAKAIEVPNDPVGTRSDFWLNVTNAIKAKKSDAFIYGEVLSSTCTTNLTDYTTYMKLTDDGVGYTALINGVKTGNVENLANAKYSKKANDNVRIAAEDSIIWAESHDTYMNTGKNNSTDQISNQKIVQTWAIVGARNESTALFFARPNATMGLASSDTTWSSAPVAEVNKFKNLFDGKSEALSCNSTTALIERGKKGAVISKISGDTSVSISVQKMVDGTYRDHVSGNTFTVSNGTLTGTVDSSGVAVIYNDGDIDDPYITASTLYLSPKPGWTLSSNRDYAMYLFNSDTQASQWVSMTAVAGTDGEIFSGAVPSGQWTGVVFVRKDSSLAMSWDNNSVKNQTVDLFPTGENDFFTVTYVDPGQKNTGTWSKYGSTVDDTPTRAGGKIYLNYTNKTWWSGDNARMCAYFYNPDIEGLKEWTVMTAETGYYASVQVPDGAYTHVIFVRINPAYDTNDWNTKTITDRVWTQTADLDPIPISENNCCKILTTKTGDNYNGEWEKYPSSHAHSYASSSWSWSADNSKATLTLTCGCGKKLIFEKTVTPVSDEDKDVYTASVRYSGQDYTDTQTVYKRPTFEGYNIALEGDIGVYFYVDFHDISTSGATVTFTQEESEPVSADLVPYEGSTYRAVYYVPPKEMGDSITATVTVNGKTITETHSVAQYLKRLYYNENGEAGTEGEAKTTALKTLARSMLNYGSKSQLQFGYKSSDYELVDYGIDSYTPASPSGLSKLSYTSDQFKTYGLTYAGSSLILNDTTTLRLFFSKDSNYDSTVTLSCSDETLTPGSKGSFVTFDIEGIAAPDITLNQAVTFSKGGASSTGTFSTRNYILNNCGSGGTLGDVVTALYDYCVKSSTYFALR